MSGEWCVVQSTAEEHEREGDGTRLVIMLYVFNGGKPCGSRLVGKIMADVNVPRVERLHFF